MNGSLRLATLLAMFSLPAVQGAAAADKVVSKTTSIEFVQAADMDARGGGVSAAPTAAQAEAAYQSARQNYMAVASGGGDVNVAETTSQSIVLEDNVAGGVPQNIALEQIKIVMDVDNVTLREVMQRIVQQAAAYSGPWTVKWRLRPENMPLLEERVNLTAEADFGDFTSLLAERVKNMTGTQLYVTAFGGTRVLLVADTYY